MFVHAVKRNRHALTVFLFLNCKASLVLMGSVFIKIIGHIHHQIWSTHENCNTVRQLCGFFGVFF